MSISDGPTGEQVKVQRFAADGSDIAVFEFEGHLRDLMVSSLRTSHLATGSYAPDAKAISPQGMLSMVVAGGALGGTQLSAAFSSKLFMATANPATLMQLKGGVGSAVMGAKGIIAQAPFLPVASTLPIVAPLMAMQAMTTMIVLQQFQQVDQKLNAIKSTLDTAIARSEATHMGELMTASVVVDEVYRLYDLEGGFSDDMLIRLALAEHDVRRLTERFRYLVDTHSLTAVDGISDVQRANFDAHSAMLASFLDLRIAYLRVCVDMQVHPKSVESSVSHLKAKISSVTDFWQELTKRSEEVRMAIQEAEKRRDDMGWAQKVLPEFAGGQGAANDKKLKALQHAYVATIENELGIMKDFDDLIHSARQTLKALENPKPAASGPAPTLVYWQDETGEHSFYSQEMGIG
jgi:hypothetical protein